MSAIEVVPLTTVLGAEVAGVELSPGLDDAVVTALRQALLQHKVLFFR
jgi:taurine dioxygenase